MVAIDRFTYATAPRLWRDETCVILASGPSLTAADVAYCRGRARILAIKDAIRLAPDADALYASDAKWWAYYGDELSYVGPRYALEMAAAPWASVLKNTGSTGLELRPDGLKTGSNSGYQAINLAVHLGARKIVLLGYDMSPANGQHHWFGAHPYPNATVPPYSLFLKCFETLVTPLRTAGVEVLNATRRTVLHAFERRSLEEALA